MKNITKSDLIALLVASADHGATMLGITYQAPVKLKKTGNPYVDKLVTKTTSLSGMINFDYESGINRQQIKEGKEPSFVAGERAWGEHVTQGVVEHNNEYSIMMRVLNSPSEVVYMIDGEKVEKSVIEDFLPAKKEHNAGNLDEAQIIRSYKVDRIKTIRINGEEYLVI